MSKPQDRTVSRRAELTTKGVDGRIREKVTVPPSNDPQRTEG